MTKKGELAQGQHIEDAIVQLRGEKVLLDADLAGLYGVTTKALNQAVKRNRKRFPQDFMFRLTAAEATELNRSQSVTGSQKHRDPRYRPFAFTEQGVAMLSSVLRSQRAVQVNVEIMRAFVRLRRILAVNTDLARRLNELERRVGEHDAQLVHVVRAIRQLMEPPPAPRDGELVFTWGRTPPPPTQPRQEARNEARRHLP